MRLRAPSLYLSVLTACILLAGCGKPASSQTSGKRALGPDEKRYALTGEILKVDAETGKLRIKHEAIEGFMSAMTMDFPASKGDIANAAEGRRIKADLIVQQKTMDYHLENVWPYDRADATAVSTAANALRQDTLIRGKGVYREIGESMPDFTLYDQNARVVQANRFLGKKILLNFIYTRCPFPNMCPLATANMQQAQKLAKEAGITDVEFISISFDPQHDTPGVLREYAEAHKIDTSNFSLLTGPEPAIKDLLAQFGVEAEFQGELAKHTLATLLVGPNGKIIHRVDGSAWDPAEFVAKMKR